MLKQALFKVCPYNPDCIVETVKLQYDMTQSDLQCNTKLYQLLHNYSKSKISLLEPTRKKGGFLSNR